MLDSHHDSHVRQVLNHAESTARQHRRPQAIRPRCSVRTSDGTVLWCVAVVMTGPTSFRLDPDVVPTASLGPPTS